MRMIRSCLALAACLLAVPSAAFAAPMIAPAHTEFIAPAAHPVAEVATLKTSTSSTDRRAMAGISVDVNSDASASTIARAATTRHYDPG